MTPIIKETPAKGITFLRSPGFRARWKLFDGFFGYPEPVEPLRRNSRASRSIFLLNTSGSAYHIKKFSYFRSYRRRDRFRGIFFFRSRGYRCFLNRLYLEEAGVGTVAPCAVLEKKTGLKKESLYITPYREVPSLSGIMGSSDEGAERKLKLFTRAVSDLYLMHSRGIRHGDTDIKNILVENGNLLWCDLDEVKKNRVLLEVRGRFKDAGNLFVSALRAIPRVGSSGDEIRDEIVRVFNDSYPGYGRIKKKVYGKALRETDGFGARG